MSSISPLTPPLQQTPGQIAAASSSTGTNSLTDPQTFLKLLVAELKYQNPLNPTDPTQYLGETAQFSMVQTLNTVGSDITAMLTASQQAAAAALIGRQVTGTDSAGDTITGVVTGMQTASGSTSLQIGNQSIPLANVTSVTASTGSTTPSTGSTGSTPSTGSTGSTTPSTGSTGSTTPSTGSTGGTTPSSGSTGSTTPSSGSTGATTPSTPTPSTTSNNSTTSSTSGAPTTTQPA